MMETDGGEGAHPLPMRHVSSGTHLDALHYHEAHRREDAVAHAHQHAAVMAAAQAMAAAAQASGVAGVYGGSGHAHPHGDHGRHHGGIHGPPASMPHVRSVGSMDQLQPHPDYHHHHPHMTPSTSHSSLTDAAEAANDLTLSYQGRSWTFEGVAPQKVEAVLLLLQEGPGHFVQGGLTGGNNMGDMAFRMSFPQRQASLNRFREKRKERCYDKKIRYTVRKEVAQRMQRKKGQFASARAPLGEDGLPIPGWEGEVDGAAAEGAAAGDAHCVNCGVNEHDTPMMRRGPAGPRTLCNACGLMWANKQVLRDVSKAAAAPAAAGAAPGPADGAVAAPCDLNMPSNAALASVAAPCDLNMPSNAALAS
eukprot:CAMPEP_0182855102 /NCGR_PEP_ID=MMETSP0034_2-20130328/1644_1 /TAXON_ID=156128 /ORGANISM="Nephroselmis pyriformis, Strain CCMP717" /LENGTH=363 /DNA_ID=CAMNT_0024986019 /DNA_START=247 /DNA_END=1335 /DNA_ORIENTATION=-